MRVLPWPPFVMRRPFATIVTLLAMVAQLGLGMSASLGLVMCVGKDHAAIELAADDCCASHGTTGPTAVATLERDCCSDIPLYEAVRVVADVPRASHASPPIVALVPSSAVVTGGGLYRRPTSAVDTPPPSHLDRRSIVLRV